MKDGVGIATLAFLLGVCVAHAQQPSRSTSSGVFTAEQARKIGGNNVSANELKRRYAVEMCRSRGWRHTGRRSRGSRELGSNSRARSRQGESRAGGLEE